MTHCLSSWKYRAAAAKSSLRRRRRQAETSMALMAGARSGNWKRWAGCQRRFRHLSTLSAEKQMPQTPLEPLGNLSKLKSFISVSLAGPSLSSEPHRASSHHGAHDSAPHHDARALRGDFTKVLKSRTFQTHRSISLKNIIIQLYYT